MRLGVPKESKRGETRVAATPKTVEQLIKLGYDVVVESGAGALASFADEQYVAAGAAIGDDGARAIEARLELARVQRAMATLPDEQREALLLVGVEGLTYEAAAVVIGCPPGSVKSRVSRARGRLAEAESRAAEALDLYTQVKAVNIAL